MTGVQTGTWYRMRFTSPEGREEALWVEARGNNTYSVLSVPVWIYGISVGSIVEGVLRDEADLTFQRVVSESAAATVRFIAPRGMTASEIYLTQVIPGAKQRGLLIGPATFFDPRLVAVNVSERKKWWPEVGTYLDGLVTDGVIEQWEVGDPDEYAGVPSEEGGEPILGAVLLHPLPVHGSGDCHVS